MMFKIFAKILKILYISNFKLLFQFSIEILHLFLQLKITLGLVFSQIFVIFSTFFTFIFIAGDVLNRFSFKKKIGKPNILERLFKDFPGFPSVFIFPKMSIFELVETAVKRAKRAKRAIYF